MQVQTVGGQIVSQRYLRWTQCTRKKDKHVSQAIAVLNLQINHLILRFGATPRTKQEDNREPGSQRGNVGRPGETRATREEGGRIPSQSVFTKSRKDNWHTLEITQGLIDLGMTDDMNHTDNNTSLNMFRTRGGTPHST